MHMLRSKSLAPERNSRTLSGTAATSGEGGRVHLRKLCHPRLASQRKEERPYPCKYVQATDLHPERCHLGVVARMDLASTMIARVPVIYAPEKVKVERVKVAIFAVVDGFRHLRLSFARAFTDIRLVQHCRATARMVARPLTESEPVASRVCAFQLCVQHDCAWQVIFHRLPTLLSVSALSL